MLERARVAIVAVSLACCYSRILDGQISIRDSIVTANGVCRIWSLPSGSPTFPDDASYNRCALDRGAKLLGRPPITAIPLHSLAIHTDFTVVVNADGSVSPGFTRPVSGSPDADFFALVRSSLMQWRFEPGTRNGAPVRSVHRIRVETVAPRNDTLPSRIEWAYKVGALQDTLVATWVAAPSPPPLSQRQLDSVYTAVFRTLVKQHLLLPESNRRYCVVMQSGDSATQGRLARWFGRVLAPHFSELRSTLPYGCERFVASARIVLPRVFRTEDNRAVLFPSGDDFPNYPIGVSGRSWRTWQSRCVAELAANESVTMNCAVELGSSADGFFQWYGEAELDRTRARNVGRGNDTKSVDDSLFITAIVSTRGAYQNDTLRSSIYTIPLLTSHALTDSVPPCGGWAAYTSQDSAELYVIHGNLRLGRLDVALVRHRPTPKLDRDGVCPKTPPIPSQFAAFIAGGVGDRVTSPVGLLFSNESKPYVIDPQKHTMAAQPHLKFRVADLRADTRSGDQIDMRIRVSFTQADVVPIVLTRMSGKFERNAARVGQPIAQGVWDFRWVSAFTSDAELFVYFIRR